MELQDVRRQTIDWQRAVSEHLSQGAIKEAVSLLPPFCHPPQETLSLARKARLRVSWGGSVCMTLVHSLQAFFVWPPIKMHREEDMGVRNGAFYKKILQKKLIKKEKGVWLRSLHFIMP